MANEIPPNKIYRVQLRAGYDGLKPKKVGPWYFGDKPIWLSQLNVDTFPMVLHDPDLEVRKLAPATPVVEPATVPFPGPRAADVVPPPVEPVKGVDKTAETKKDEKAK